MSEVTAGTTLKKVAKLVLYAISLFNDRSAQRVCANIYLPMTVKSASGYSLKRLIKVCSSDIILWLCNKTTIFTLLHPVNTLNLEENKKLTGGYIRDQSTALWILTEYLLQSVRSTVQSTLAIFTSVRPENSLLERSSHVGARFLQWPHLQ